MKHILLLLLILPSVAVATPSKIKLNGAAKYFLVPKGKKEISFEAISRGNLTSILEIEGNIPKGAKVKVFTAPISKKLKKKDYYRLNLIPQDRFQEEHSECMNVSIQTEPDEEDLIDIELYPEIDSPVCDEIGDETLTTLSTQFSETFGGNWRPGNACSYLLSVAGDIWLDPTVWCEKLTEKEKEVLAPYGFTCSDESLPSEFSSSDFKSTSKYIHLKGHFYKNTCMKKKRYRLKIELDLKNAVIERDTARYYLRVKESKMKKGREAALKPESEGRYSPRPILMMNWIDSSCGNKMQVTKWKKGKPKRKFPLDVYSLLSHRDMVLALGVVDSALIGGKGVATLSNGENSYSVCFKLKRERQNKNGYPY